MRADGRATAGTVLLAWLAMIGFDFFLHGGLLARWYVRPSPFLLPPRVAFARIPAGYLSFLLLALLLVLLLQWLDLSGGRAGSRFGLLLGALIWGALGLGLWSITTAPVALLTGWAIGQAVELALGGWVAGERLAGRSTRTLLPRLLLFIALLVVFTFIMQATGLAPVTRL